MFADLSIVGINEYDMVEVKILKNGGKQIPGNGMLVLPTSFLVTAMDLYKALGTRLMNTTLGAPGSLSSLASRAEPSSKPAEDSKVPESSPAVSVSASAPAAPVSAPVSAPAVAAVAPAATTPISVPKPNAFSVKAPAAVNAFAVKAPLPKANAFAVKKPAAAPAAAPSVPEPTAEPSAAPAPSAFAVKAVKPVSAFSVKTGVNKFTIKKP